MAGVQVSVDDTVMQRRLRAMQQGILDASPLMRIWGEIIRTSVEENFEVGGRPLWQPLAAATIRARIGARRQLQKRSAKNMQSRRLFAVTFLRPLWVTGTLKQVTVRPESQRVTVGTPPAAKAYAAIQQFGGQAGRGHAVQIPARPYLVLQEEDLQEMQRAARQYLRERAQ